MPETIAEKRKTIGMRGVDHQGFALIDPKMNPTYPWRRNADGMPMIVMNRPTLSSIRRDSSLMLSTPRPGPGRAALQPVSGPRQQHDVLAVVEPDLEDEDGHQVPEVDEPEHRHRRATCAA